MSETSDPATTQGRAAASGVNANAAGSDTLSEGDPQSTADPTVTGEAVASQQAGPGAVVAAFGLLAAGGFVAWTVWSSGANPAKIEPSDTTAVFLTLLVFAAALERLVEPFSRWLPGRRDEAASERTLAAATNRADVSTEAVAAARTAVARARANRTIVAWGLASGLATVASSATGFYVLHAVAGPDWNGLAVWIDAIITGVMIGSGTKPLHDLISRAQNGPPSA
ncbi:hypothetical protein E1211_03190 [Micromonospora sp. 15K316]|uniref:hypothetical protein n=1 Tax=Micromonospora sp. 15K316 TaxID=2530376 RepID=UPI00104852AF|nr:hypothetical protein [Micromonospora sp. 15K316]TDC39782.1 hypothetical protein E1211_03190 [Micromonospora sp. 15K316]